MNNKKLRKRSLLWRHIFMMLLFTVALSFLQVESTQAQTGAPPPQEEPVITPPPGTTVVEPTFPADAPENVPPVTGEGVLAVVPETADGGVAPVNFTLDDVTNLPIVDAPATLLVPASETEDIAVAIQPLQQDSSSLPEPLPEAAPGTIQLAFSIDVYRVNSGEVIHTHQDPLILAIDLPDGVDPNSVVLLHYNELTGEYEQLPVTVDPDTGVITALIFETSPFGLAIGGGQPTFAASEAPEVVIPTGLPTTGGQSTQWLWGFMALIGMIVTGFSLWHRREREIT